MRTGALVLGITGGVFGLLSAIAALFIGGVGVAFEDEGSGFLIGLGFSALFFCFLGLLGAALALAKPRAAAALMLISAIGITISISWFALIAAPLFLIAALLAFFGRHTPQERMTVLTETDPGGPEDPPRVR